MISKIHPIFFRFNNKLSGQAPTNFCKNYTNNFFSTSKYAKDIKISFLLKHFFNKENLFVTFIRIEINLDKIIIINIFLNQNHFLKMMAKKIKNHRKTFLFNGRAVYIKKMKAFRKINEKNRQFIKSQINIFKGIFIMFKKTANYYNSILSLILKEIQAKLTDLEIETFEKFRQIYKNKLLIFKTRILIKYIYKLYIYFYNKITKILEHQKYIFIKILQKYFKFFLLSPSLKPVINSTITNYFSIKINSMLLNSFSKGQQFLFNYINSISKSFLHENNRQKTKIYEYLPNMFKSINLCANSFSFPKHLLKSLRNHSILQIKKPLLKSLYKLKNIEYLNKYKYKLCLKILKSNILSPEYINSCMIEGISKKVKATVVLKNMYNYLSRYIFSEGLKEGLSIKGFKIHIKGRIMNAPRTKHLRTEYNTLNLATIDTQLLYNKQHAKSHFGAYTIRTWIQYLNL